MARQQCAYTRYLVLTPAVQPKIRERQIYLQVGIVESGVGESMREWCDGLAEAGDGRDR